MVEVWKIHTLLAFGAVVSGVARLITLPAIAVTLRLSTVPVGRITERVVLVPIARPVASSTVTAEVVPETMRPPRRLPARTGSATSMICPGRTTTPASIEAVKLITSDS